MPHLVSHIYEPTTNQLTSLVYDAKGRLIFVHINPNGGTIKRGSPQERGSHQDDSTAKELYVVTDQTGAPILYFTKSGELVKELNWSPYGQVDNIIFLFFFILNSSFLRYDNNIKSQII